MTDLLPKTVACGFRDHPAILVQLSASILPSDKGILDQAREFGWRVINLDFTRMKIPKGCHVVGALIRFPVDHPSSAWVKGLSCPVVRLGRMANPLDDRLPAVISDYETAGRLAAEHLAERNLRQVAMVAPRGMMAGGVAWESFRRRAEELGCDSRVLSFSSEAVGNSWEWKLEAETLELKQFLKPLPKPVGLFCLTEVLGGRLIIMAQSAGFAVPEDVAVLGCGSQLTYCETTTVPMSMIDLGGERQGREGVRLLYRLVNGEKAPSAPVIISPTGVVERHSTNVLVVSDPAVSRTLRLIWDHLDKEISVTEIARQVGTSRRSLERSFQRCVGRSITAERQRKRLERCAELLRGTKWSIEAVAASVGLPSRSYLYRLFRKRFGVTPADFRAQDH